MRISINWIKELVPALDASADEIADRLSRSGFEVEAKERQAERFQQVVVGRVDSVEAHPDPEVSVRVTKVFDGEATHTVICGAPNVAPGQKIALAKIGANLPNGMKIERRKIRGIESEGMICSEKELGLSDRGEGILVLDAKAKPGKLFAAHEGLDDVLLEVAVTPNRPDALSHFGLARELAALFGVKIKEARIKLKETKTTSSSRAKIAIENDRSLKYLGRVLTGVKVGPSPAWLERRLSALGQRSISNVVDATNLALLELGHPLHAFDLAKLSGAKILVRTANTGEKLKTLDAQDRELNEDDLVVADAEKPVALAGVMGGFDTAVSEATSDILLECALFDAGSVRRSARRHMLHTDASHHFERGVDPLGLERAIDRCAELIVELAGGEVLKGYAVAKKKLPVAPVVGVRPKRAELVLGRPVDAKEVKATLGRLGMEAVSAPKKAKKGSLYFRSPSWRVDLNREEDLIEEIARVAGFDAIPTLMPPTAGKVWTEGLKRDPERRVRELLSHRGFLETVSLAFNSRAQAEAFGLDAKNAVVVTNPLNEDGALMRLSLLPAMVKAARLNERVLPSITDLRLFEIGHTFAWASSTDGAREKLPVERKHVAMLFRGRRVPSSWANTDKVMVDAFDVKSAIEAVLAELRMSGARYESIEVSYLHPRSSTRVFLGEEELGVFGELHPDVMQKLDLEGTPIFIADLFLDTIARHEGGHRRFVPLATQPPARRDLSFFVDRSISAEKILGAIGERAHLESVELFDVYEGKAEDAKKSIAIALTFRASERTLTDAEVEDAVQKIRSGLTSSIGAQIRDA
jgi:phenylalanyl-tRNA synthetase beta chain